MSKKNHHLSWQYWTTFILIVILFLCSSNTFAGGKVGIYGIYMVPSGEDAKNFSRPGYGAGIHLVAPFPQLFNFFAVTGGFEFINLLNDNTTFRDQLTGLRVDQETSQNYYRLYIGGQVGGHGRGFIRPHAGLNLALVIYSIGTDVVIPDDYDREKEIRQNLQREINSVFGYDITLGVDLNFWNKWNLDGGVRYLKSFSLPQQLGEGSEKIHPEYFQFYLGVGISFRTISKGG